VDQITPGLAGGASVVFVTMLVGAIFRVIQLMGKQRTECQAECEVLRVKLAWEQQGKDAMIHACQQAVPPVPIPAIVWQRPPPGAPVDET
jgi:hypothetical protein